MLVYDTYDEYICNNYTQETTSGDVSLLKNRIPIKKSEIQSTENTAGELFYYPGVTETDVNLDISKILIKELKNQNKQYQKEMVIMTKKLNNCVPMHTIVYLVVNSIVFSISLLLIILRYSKNLYLFDPYYLFCSAIISLGLFLTAAVSIKDWKEYMIGEKEK